MTQTYAYIYITYIQIIVNKKQKIKEKTIRTFIGICDKVY